MGGMTDDKSSSGLAKAVQDIGVPLYRHAEPAVHEAGRALETVMRAFNVALLPVRGLVWGAEQLEEFLQSRVATKLRNTPPAEIVTPKANVAGPAFEGVRFTEGEDDLQGLFANLIASAMDKRTAAGAHPAFARIINELTSDEAKILRAIGPGRPVPVVNIDRAFLNDRGERISGDTPHESLSRFGHDAGCELPQMFPTFISNLVRLRLVESLAPGTKFNSAEAEEAYQRIETDPEVVALAKSYDSPPGQKHEFVRWGVKQTPLGRDFWKVCVQPYEDRVAWEWPAG
jgi:hypothetical protein